MLIAIVGTYNDLKNGSIRGNGKTLSAIFLAYKDYLEGKKIYANFYTTFGQTVTLNELTNLFRDEKLSNTTIIIDEAQVYLSNTGVKAKTLKEIINLFIAQTRKRNINIIVTSQRFLNLHKQLRIQCDIILIPTKHHLDKNGQLGETCIKDNCIKNHAILIYNINQDCYLPYILNPLEIGKLYNSDEIVFDTYKIKEVKK